jgi:cell division protein FtsB
MLVRVLEAIQNFIHDPKRVFIVCLFFVLVTLLADGTLIKIWGLNQDILKVQSSLSQVNVEIEKVEKQIHQANEPAYIEREARDRFDLVEDNDLVFVFAGEDEI